MKFNRLILLNIILCALTAVDVAVAAPPAAAPVVPWPPPVSTVSWQEPGVAQDAG